MKSTRLLTIILLVAVCVFGWVTFLSGLGADEAQQRQLLEQARAYQQERLYQLALDKCYDAIDVLGDAAAYDCLLDICQAYYDEDQDGAYYDLMDAYEAATSAFPEESSYWEGYVQMYLDNGKYSNAGSLLRKARSYHVQSQILDAQWQTAYYAYKALNQSYLQMSGTAYDGMYVVQEDEGYGVVEAAGAEVLRSVYAYVGPFSAEGYVLAVTPDGEARILDAGAVMYGRFRASVVQARGYSEGMVAVQLEGRSDWCFLDHTGRELFGGYLQAGMFQDGAAAVQLPGGQWCLIGTDGVQCSEETWDEILLAENGAYDHDGRMMTRTGEAWTLRDTDGNQVSDLVCEKIDICLDGAIAFCQNGKWGFMKRSGDVLIEPCYDGARSFSCGVAAVCMDGLWGFIDEDGNLVVDYTFDDAAYFSTANNCCRVLPQGGDEYKLIRWQISR